MAHKSDNSRKLQLTELSVDNVSKLEQLTLKDAGVFLFWLPFGRTSEDGAASKESFQKIKQYCLQLHKDSTICILTTPPDAALLLPHLSELKFHHWIAVKTTSGAYNDVAGQLSSRHAVLLVLTRYNKPLKHTVTRINYTYCPACTKTTKDYGGKTHMYHYYGTAISDVWRDIEWDPKQGVALITDRLRDLFGVEIYRALYLINLHECKGILPRSNQNVIETVEVADAHSGSSPRLLRSRLIHADCVEALPRIPDDSVDFCFADLPYNLKKKYYRWKDDLESSKYFEWCESWLAELYRVLKPGRTLAVLNIPLYAARHCEFLSTLMKFQTWIAWDALSIPARKIMPAHYGIVCFSKGEPRDLPGLGNTVNEVEQGDYLTPQAESFCYRPSCVSHRSEQGVNDRAQLSNLWNDIHRLKHNSQRVNHPCQLPPLLMRRLFALFTLHGEMILDNFDGAGTSTLVARQMGRRYIGIEHSKRYHNLAGKRHEQLMHGENPFGKNNSVPKAKNSYVARLSKQTYPVSKKNLQLYVKELAAELGRMPCREDIETRRDHPIEYFDDYFIHWGEVCAAARTTRIPEIQT